MDIITKGGNYGWATWEGTNSPPSGVSTNGQPVPANPIFPIVTYAHGSSTYQGDAVIGGVVYRGSRFPQLNGVYVYGDDESGNVWRLTYDGTNATAPQQLFGGAGRISAFGIDPSNGDVLYANLASGNNSIIERIVSTNSVPLFNSLKISGANLVAGGTNGPHSGNYYLLTSTNLLSPFTNWARVSTNPFDANGGFIFTNPVNPNAPALFYLLQLQ